MNRFTNLAKYIRPLLTDRNIDIILIVLSILVGAYQRWELIDILFFALVIKLILHPLPSRILFMIFVFFIVFTPVFLLANREYYAEQFSVYAYYALIFFIGTLFFESKLRKDKQGGK